MRVRAVLIGSAVVGAVFCAATGCDDAEAPEGRPDAIPVSGPVCAFDDSESAETALPLALGEASTGSICPVEDQDWHAFEVPAGHALARVELAMDAPVSPVEPTYLVRDARGAVVATPAATEVGGALEVDHCLAPGAYHVVVRDRGDDAQDRRNQYQLIITTAPEPDGAEPNDDAEAAADLRLGDVQTGYIACVGDADWFRVELGDDEVLRYELAMPAGGVHPQVRVLDAAGEVLYREANPAGRREATALSRGVTVRGAGSYFVVVDDDDGADADPGTAYTLSVTATEQLDLNEPNDRAAVATELDAVSCGAEWTEWQTRQGTIGAVGDPDWFRVETEGCDNGLIEAEANLQTDALGADALAELRSELQLSLALVRAHEPSPCEADDECRELNLECSRTWDCAGFFNACQPSGRCAGATACLKESVCGAFETERHQDAGVDDGSPSNGARVSAPIFDRLPLYLRVGDFGGNGQAPTVFYDLRFRVRRDPDTHEPSNVYTPQLTGSDDLGVQRSFARAHHEVMVHDCTWRLEADAGLGEKGEADAAVSDAAVSDVAVSDAAVSDAAVPDAAVPDVAVPDAAVPDIAVPDAGPPPPPGVVPGCCGPDDWIEGAISYEADQDWYVYNHPCPGEDCMVRIRFEVDGGPVDQLWQVFEGNRVWFDSVLPTEERADNPAYDGAFGGLGAEDTCFYAFGGHGDGQHYSLAIRDLLPRADWQPDQRYRFCIEKVARTCVEPPCRISENGQCDAP